MGFLKRDKEAGQDGSFHSLFKDDAEVLVLMLILLLGSLWAREEIPKDTCKS